MDAMSNEARSRDAATFDRDGFAIVAAVVSGERCDAMVDALAQHDMDGAGSRLLLQRGPFRLIANDIRRNPEIAGLLATHAEAVQCTLFAKGPDALWSVTPHQDLSIPVRERRSLAGWKGWSEKEGVIFVQPPDAVLQQLVAVRLHLDEQTADNGPLDVVPGSHLHGRLSHNQILEYAAGHRDICIVPRGGALVIRPLLIHSSIKPRNDRHRRVLQFLYGPPLPDGMQWAERSPA
jgi:hypothetical protein